jgi:hypothetical protein
MEGWLQGTFFSVSQKKKDANQDDHPKQGSEFKKTLKLITDTRKIRMCHLELLKNSYTKLQCFSNIYHHAKFPDNALSSTLSVTEFSCHLVGIL